MFGSAFHKAIDAFSQQFAEEDGRLVYRRNRTGPALVVSEQERDEFIRRYRKAYRLDFIIALIGFFAAFAAMFFALEAASIDFDSDLGQIAMWAFIIVSMIAFMCGFFYRYYEPARVLARRTPSADALTSDQQRSLLFDKLSYGQIALCFPAGAYIVWSNWDGSRIDRFVFGFMGAALIIFGVVQMARKFLHERASLTP